MSQLSLGRQSSTSSVASSDGLVESELAGADETQLAEAPLDEPTDGEDGAKRHDQVIAWINAKNREELKESVSATAKVIDSVSGRIGHGKAKVLVAFEKIMSKVAGYLQNGPVRQYPSGNTQSIMKINLFLLKVSLGVSMAWDDNSLLTRFMITKSPPADFLEEDRLPARDSTAAPSTATALPPAPLSCTPSSAGQAPSQAPPQRRPGPIDGLEPPFLVPQPDDWGTPYVELRVVRMEHVHSPYHIDRTLHPLVEMSCLSAQWTSPVGHCTHKHELYEWTQADAANCFRVPLDGAAEHEVVHVTVRDRRHLQRIWLSARVQIPLAVFEPSTEAEPWDTHTLVLPMRKRVPMAEASTEYGTTLSLAVKRVDRPLWWAAKEHQAREARFTYANADRGEAGAVLGAQSLRDARPAARGPGAQLPPSVVAAFLHLLWAIWWRLCRLFGGAEGAHPHAGAGAGAGCGADPRSTTKQDKLD